MICLLCDGPLMRGPRVCDSCASDLDEVLVVRREIRENKLRIDVQLVLDLRDHWRVFVSGREVEIPRPSGFVSFGEYLATMIAQAR
jgi:hypothetical protein